MSLFNLKDIRYLRDDIRNFQSVSKQYDSNVLKYPIDIGSTDKGHYMLIHINVQEKTSYRANLDENNLPAIFRSKNRTNIAGNLGNTIQGASDLAGSGVRKLSERTFVEDGAGNMYETTSTLNKNIASFTEQSKLFINKIGNSQFAEILKTGVGGALTEKPLDNVSFLRKIKRTKDSIALYMPSTLSFTHNQSYSGLNLGGEAISTAASLGSIVSDFAQGKITGNQTFTNLTPFAGKFLTDALQRFGPNSLQALFTSAFGVVQNPMMELIYTRPDFRTFRFDFNFNPRSEREAIEVYNIIQRLYFHQAPEIAEGSAGFFLVPPSEFDIEFYYNGIQNPNIPKISTCVLESIDVDYAPSQGGFTAYEVPGENIPSPGKTGTPVSIRLSLSFRETEIVTKANYDARKKNEIFDERDV